MDMLSKTFIATVGCVALILCVASIATGNWALAIINAGIVLWELHLYSQEGS